ncbi:DNA topoisomerase IV subunit A [Sphingosinicella soli]|uniref:DNA topoisomerase 4 subunit A n=1 Tax=Sphingosinicella soli TaxID=333708 RepID=A0A7W7AZD3_9SPHN|nr:DNA topoisomerase IV subunit A [Sphingosinicella soli]MBB4631151.1 topoisomerase-4 subunit A [Sphingosinicella soli]
MTDLLDPESNIIEAPFGDALADRYLVYALSTITARSLPDVRDGLKPVHRRLLWAMRLLKLDPGQGYKKCARVVGDVIGKYHPHGDVAVYDAMVRLAQSFSLRYPLVDGQGNFGNIDGDNAAAYRYTEARLTQVAIDLMAGLDEDATDLRPTYNGEDEEPEVMPGLFPNLLANGASGIAVGMATSIPPHNAAELIDAAVLLIDQPGAELDQLLEHVKGPDFPTGALIVDGPASIREAYATGRGSFRVRARFAGREDPATGKWMVEPEKLSSGMWQLVITEIPYGVQKGKLIEQIAQLIADRKLPILEDVRDESDEAVRIVIVPKSRNVEPDVLIESLYRLTELETRFSLNLNVLDAERTPRVMSLKEVLTQWLSHQITVLLRRSRHRLAKIDDRMELLEGYLIAYLNLDRVIEIIRTEDEPKVVMIAEFGLNDRQAEAILNMRLRSLRRLEEMEIRKERDNLAKEREGLVALIDSPARQRTRLKRDLAVLRDRYGFETALGARRTRIEEASATREIPLEAMIEKEPITVVVSAKGWARAMKGHLDLSDPEAFKFKEGDGPAFAFHAQTTDKILIAADNGRFYTVGADKLPGGRGFGEPLRLLVDIEGDAAIAAVLTARAEMRVLLVANDGRGFIAANEDLLGETRKGRQVMTFKKGVRLHSIRAIDAAHDHLALIGENRKLLIVPIAEIPVMVRGQGVALQKYRDGGLSDALPFRLADGLSWTMGGKEGRTRTETDLANWMGARAQVGRLPPMGFPRSNRFD